MIVKLVVVHNEQVSAWVLNATCIQLSNMADVSAGVLGLAFSLWAFLKGHCLPCQTQVSREVAMENKLYYSEAASHLQMKGG